MTDTLLRRLLATTVWNLHDALLGASTPHQRRMSDYMNAPPRPGDLVMEISTCLMPDQDAHRFGRFVSVIEQQVPDLDAEEIAMCETAGEPLPTERVWTVEPEPGVTFRWVNARFVRVPEDVLSRVTGEWWRR